jgi:hypothetical protein
MLELLDQTSGLLIAIVGGIFTYFYNRRQHELVAQRDRESERLQLLETTEKMIPHLHGDSREAALVALSNLAGSTKLILSLADLYPGRAAAVACLDILDKEETSRDLSLVRRPLFYSLYSAAGEVGELGVIELLDERLHEDERQEIVNGVDSQGRTAMMNAAKHNRGGTILKLARLGAQIDACDRAGETALHHAARYGNRNAIKALLELADELPVERRARFLNQKARRAWTALDRATSNVRKPPDPERIGHYEAVARRLKAAGVSRGDWWD